MEEILSGVPANADKLVNDEKSTEEKSSDVCSAEVMSNKLFIYLALEFDQKTCVQ